MERNLLDGGRAVAGLCLGALCGAAMVAIAFVTLMVAESQSKGPIDIQLASAAPFFILAFLLALAAYAVGLALVGAPAWAALHACRLHSWPAAALLGAVLNSGVALLLLVLMQPPTPATLPEIETYVAFFVPVGATVGWVVWRIAYRRGPNVEAQIDALS